MADVFRLVAAVTQLKSRVQALTAQNAKLTEELEAERKVPISDTRETDAQKQQLTEPLPSPLQKLQAAPHPSSTNPLELCGVFQVATEEVLRNAAREVFLRSLRHQS